MHLAANVHCWKYSRLLQVMLSSFHLYPPTRHHFSMTVCYCEEDKRTNDVLSHFTSLPFGPNYVLQTMCAAEAILCARAIGKNHFAQSVLDCEEDWAWFTDADYSVGPGGLDAICDLLEKQTADAVHFPESVSTVDYDAAENFLSWIEQPNRIYTVDRTPNCMAAVFEQRFKVAIGGIQFVPLKTLRRVGGYCQDSERHQRPSPNGWRENKEDKAFRKQVGATVKMPSLAGNLFRLRHRVRGADAGPGEVVDL